MTAERKNNETILTRRAFLKGLGLGMITASLPFLSSGCEKTKSPDELQENLHTIVNHLTTQGKQTRQTVTTEDGSSFDPTIYSDTISPSPSRSIELSYTVAKPIRPQSGKSEPPALTITDRRTNEQRPVVIIMDFNANGINANELDLVITKGETVPARRCSQKLIDSLNYKYALLAKEIVDQLK